MALKLKTIALAASCAVAVQAAAIDYTFQGTGVITAYIDGTQYGPVDPLPLPIAWTWDLIPNTTCSRITVNMAASRTTSSSGTQLHSTFGRVRFGYTAMTTDEPPSGILFLKSRITGTTEATAMVWKSQAKASSKSRVFYWPTQSSATAVYGKQMVEVTHDGPGRYFFFKQPSPVYWVHGQNGINWSPVVMETMDILSTASAYYPGGIMNNTAATSSATSVVVIEPLKMFPSSEVIGGLLPPGSKVISLEVRNSNGAHLDSLGTNVDSGTFAVPFSEYDPGDYHIYASVPGALQTRIDVSWDGSTSITNLAPTMRFGDLDGDNYVSAAEVAYVQSMIGHDISTTEGALGTDPTSTYQPYQADLNGDGVITNDDYLLALPNVGMTGDQ